MKVKDLVARLGELDEDVEVVCYTEDEGILAPGQVFRLLDILGVNESEAEKRRTEDGTPTLKLGRSPNSQKLALIDVTGDF